jgi:hypothetical protein
MVDNKSINLSSSIEWLDNEAEAAISLNPLYQWVKLVVCDDIPNGNKQQIEEAEFPNLIKTGISSPIKMADKKISDGHGAAFGHPIGVISQLKQEGNKLLALAALWKKERPEDVSMLKDMYTSGNPPNVSWEISYSESELVDGVEKLKGCILNGLAIVGMPAYQGRTPFIAMSSLDVEEVTAELGEAAVWTRAFIDTLSDSAFLYTEDGGSKDGEGKITPRSLRHFPYRDKTGKIDLPHLRNALASIPQSNVPDDVKTKLENKAKKLLQEANSSTEDNNIEMEKTLEQLEAELKVAQDALAAKQLELDAKAAEFAELKTKLETIEPEYTTLKDFKASIDTEKEKVEKLTSIKNKFKEAGLDKDEAYFTEKEETLLKLEEAELDFMIQELAAFKVSSASLAVPNLINTKTGVSNKDLVNYLKEQHSKKTN